MNKFLKILGVIVVLIAVVAIALVVIIKVLITPERIKETVLPMAEQSLQRKISLGEIQVSLFSGVELQDFTIYEDDGQEVFVSTDLVRLRYQLLPLLAMKLVIDEVRLEKPHIRVVRMADKSFNFSSLGGVVTQQTDTPAEKPSPSGQDGDSGTPINLLVSTVRIQGGELLFLDHVLNDQAPYRYQISDLEVAANSLTLDGIVPIAVKGQLNGATLAMDGKVHLKEKTGKLKIDLHSLDVAGFKPYFKDVLPGQLGGLKLDLATILEGGPQQLSVSGNLQASDIDLLLDALPDAPLEKAQLKVDYELETRFEDDRLAVQRLDLDYNGINVNISGNVDQLTAEPLLDLNVDVPKLDIRQAISAVPKSLVAGVADLNPAGHVDVNLKLVGGFAEPVKLLKKATLALSKVQATAGGQRPSLEGRLMLTGDQLVSEELNVRIGDNTARIDLTGNNLYAQPVVITADIYSERFLIDPLLQDGAAASGGSDGSEDESAGNVAKNDSSSTEVLGPFDIPVRANGTVRLAETLWKGLAIKEFLAQYELKDNILTISRMEGQVAGGSFSNKTRVDLGKKGLAYDATFGLKAIQSDPLLAALAPKAAGALLGQMDMDMTIQGRGTDWESISKKLSGQGDMLVGQGRLVSPGLVKGLAGVLQLPDMDEIDFDDFAGNFTIKDGKVLLNSKISSSQIKLAPKGAVGLDGLLDLSLNTSLSPELSARLDQKGKVARYLTDQDGWTQVPLLLSGSFSQPRFGLDPKGLQAQAGKALQGELNRQLDKLFDKPKTESQTDGESQTEEPAEDPSQKLLKDSLQRLFGN
jgi:AsmA protein